MAGWRYCWGGTAWEVVHCQRGPAVPLLLYRGEGVAVVAAECQRRSRGVEGRRLSAGVGDAMGPCEAAKLGTCQKEHMSPR